LQNLVNFTKTNDYLVVNFDKKLTVFLWILCNRWNVGTVDDQRLNRHYYKYNNYYCN